VPVKKPSRPRSARWTGRTLNTRRWNRRRR